MSDDAFQRVADRVNADMRAAFALSLGEVLETAGPTQDCSSQVMAALAGMISAAGVLCASAPGGLGDLVTDDVLLQQFNAGRADYFVQQREGAAS